jgi:phosphoribosylanthranilate isomerase
MSFSAPRAALGLSKGGIRPVIDRPWVKVCGVTRVEDAVAAVELGAAMIGINFHPPSPRCVAVERAREIAAAVGGRAPVVGVFVNQPVEEIEAVRQAAGLDLVQLHGDEGPDEVAALGGRVVKVVRVPRESPPAAAGLDRELARYPAAWGFLFDVRHPELYGGSGESFGWGVLAGLDRGALGGRPLLVAGGIVAGNAARALAESGADGVDVASGVESAPGVKIRDEVEKLLRQVRGLEVVNGPQQD